MIDIISETLQRDQMMGQSRMGDGVTVPFLDVNNMTQTQRVALLLAVFGIIAGTLYKFYDILVV